MAKWVKSKKSEKGRHMWTELSRTYSNSFHFVDSVDVEYYTLIFSYVDWKDRKPLQENPPELTPEEKARALDAASNMQIEAKDQEADILKATSDMIW